ncbi:hypothetical protein N7478_003580 [Penicillium angulare]|uniref:uncharacterized protein n=1 Tax=Penicillium angulare TaxID=116970 RepID=UPI0025402591|nr:uncharacterized protein N7478_003580 [Penicillium angulare]KAJ5287894.1 hypothetical protein N7478_003580 [Penicillium angulare]
MDIQTFLAYSKRQHLASEALRVDPPQRLTRPQVRALAHQVHFGAPGCPPPTRIRASDSSTTPFSEPVSVPWDLDIPTHYLPRLLNGFCPRDQQDIYFIYAAGPDSTGHATVYFYRKRRENVRVEVEMIWDDSIANFLKAGVTSITWEGDAIASPHAAEDYAKFLFLEASNWVLGIKLETEIQEPLWWKSLPLDALKTVNQPTYSAVHFSEESLALLKPGTIITT